MSWSFVLNNFFRIIKASVGNVVGLLPVVKRVALKLVPTVNIYLLIQVIEMVCILLIDWLNRIRNICHYLNVLLSLNYSLRWIRNSCCLIVWGLCSTSWTHSSLAIVSELVIARHEVASIHRDVRFLLLLSSVYVIYSSNFLTVLHCRTWFCTWVLLYWLFRPFVGLHQLNIIICMKNHNGSIWLALWHVWVVASLLTHHVKLLLSLVLHNGLFCKLVLTRLHSFTVWTNYLTLSLLRLYQIHLRPKLSCILKVLFVPHKTWFIDVLLAHFVWCREVFGMLYSLLCCHFPVWCLLRAKSGIIIGVICLSAC